MRTDEPEFSLRRCGLPMALLAAGTMTLITLGFVTADAQETAPKAEAPAAAATASGPDVPAERRAEIEKVIREYLLANPELFAEVQEAYEAKRAKAESDKAMEAIKGNVAEIFKDPNAAVAGNPDGDVTVVQFFDYNCSACRHGFPDVAKVLKDDPKVKVVFRELPIINQASAPVSKIALAARKQGKYFELHKALMSAQGVVTDKTALAKAEALGLDIKKLKEDMASPEIQAELDKTLELSTKLGINGTPFFIVGDQVLTGVPRDLSELVANTRKSGCSYC